MQNIKKFTFSEMPKHIADQIFELGCANGHNFDNLLQYQVGGYIDEYDNAWEEDKKGYDLYHSPEKEKEERELTQWFLDNGAEMLESVYIGY